MTYDDESRKILEKYGLNQGGQQEQAQREYDDESRQILSKYGLDSGPQAQHSFQQDQEKLRIPGQTARETRREFETERINREKKRKESGVDLLMPKPKEKSSLGPAMQKSAEVGRRENISRDNSAYGSMQKDREAQAEARKQREKQGRISNGKRNLEQAVSEAAEKNRAAKEESKKSAMPPLANRAEAQPVQHTPSMAPMTNMPSFMNPAATVTTQQETQQAEEPYRRRVGDTAAGSAGRLLNSEITDSGSKNRSNMVTDEEAQAEGYANAAEKAGAEKANAWLENRKDTGRQGTRARAQAEVALKAEKAKYEKLKEEADMAQVLVTQHEGDMEFDENGRLVMLTAADIAKRERAAQEATAALEAQAENVRIAEYALQYSGVEHWQPEHIQKGSADAVEYYEYKAGEELKAEDEYEMARSALSMNPGSAAHEKRAKAAEQALAKATAEKMVAWDKLSSHEQDYQEHPLWTTLASIGEKGVIGLSQMSASAFDFVLGRNGILGYFANEGLGMLGDGINNLVGKDVIPADVLRETNPFTELHKGVNESAAVYGSAIDERFTGKPIVNKAVEAGAQAVQMVPLFVLMAMTGGVGAGATTENLQYIANVNTASNALQQYGLTASHAARAIAHSPAGQYTFAQEFSSSFDEAKEDGASWVQAVLYATTVASVNTLLEFGDEGIEFLPENIKKAAGSFAKFKTIAAAPLQEIKEENLQQMFSKAATTIYKNVEWYSTTNPNAVVNPAEIWRTSVDTALATLAMIPIQHGIGKLAQLHEIGEVKAQTQAQSDVMDRLLKAEKLDTEQDSDINTLRALEEMSKDKALGAAFKQLYKTDINEAVSSWQSMMEEDAQIRAQEAAGAPQAQGGTEIAESPAEAPTEAPDVLNSQAEASKPYTAVDALTGENPRVETAPSPATESRGFTKPDLGEAKTRAQEAVTRMIGEARDQADMLDVMEQIIDEPTQVYAQAFYDLTGIEPEDYMAQLSAPSASAYADYYGFDDEDEAYDRAHPGWRNNRGDATGIDFLIGDQYNPEHGQGIRPNSQLAIDAYAAQQQREKGYGGKSWYDDAIETAIVQIKEDGRNAGRIAGGQGEWAEFTPRERAEILRQATGKEYYVSGNEVVKSKGRVESDTDNKNGRFYEYDLKAAGVNDTPPSEDIESKKIYERESAEKEGKKFTDREEPPSYVGRMRQQYDEESLSEFGKSIRRADAMNHRANMEKWREEQYGGKLIKDPALGTPNSSLRSDQLQRIMRSEERLDDLIKGEGNFAKYGVDRRFDMLRAMYPDAGWKIDAKTDQIIRPTEPVKNPSEPADVWHRDTTPDKKTVDTKKAKESAVLEGLQNKAKQSSSGLATGEGRIVSRSELEARAKRAAVAANRGLGLSADQGGPGKGREIGAGGAGQRNGSGAPVLTKEQFPHWEAGLDHAEKLNAKFIGKTTKAMDAVSEHCRKMGVPCTHLDITALAKDLGAATSTGGFSLGYGGVFIGWGKGMLRNGATDHEIIHFKAYEKYGAHEGAAPLATKAAKVLDKPSVDGIKRVFRAIYENKYSKDRFLTTYDKLSNAQKLTIDKLINAEIFGDACANVYDKFRNAGLTVSQFTAFHNACLDAAVAADLITSEERAEMESFQKKPVRDDYAKELNAPKENDQAKAKPEQPDAKPKEPKPRKPRAKKADAIEALLKEYDRDQKLRDYETMRTAEEEESLGGINPVDVWNDDFDQEAYAPPEEEAHAKEEASAEKEAPAEEKAASEKPKPKKKSPYTPNKEYNERMQQREDQREADEKSYQAEHGEPESSGEYRSKPQREAREELDKEEQRRLDQEKLDQEKAEKERREFQAKQRWGEEAHKELSKLADAIEFRVGNKRVGSSKLERYQAKNGDIKYSGTSTVYETESERPGGRYLKPVADAVRGLVEGRNDARAVSDAYEYLNSKSQEKTGAYFYDEQLGSWLSDWAEDVEDAMKNPVHSSTKTDSLEVPALPSKLAQRGVELLTVMEHRIKAAQNSLSERAGFGDAFKTSQKVKDGIRGYADDLLKATQRIQLRPTTAFKLMGGFNSETGRSFYNYADRVQKSTRNFINTYQGAVDYIQDLTSHKGYNKFLNGNSQVKNVIPGLDYKGDTISANLAVGILKTLETSGAIDHIIRTGVVEVPRMESDFYNDRNSKGFGDKKGYSKIFDPISAETRKMLSDAEASHDDYALDAANARAQREMDKLVKDLHKVIEADPVAKLAYDVSSNPMAYLARAMNKTSKTIWGIKVATQGNSYWPLLAANTFGGDRLLNSSHLGGMNGERIVQSRTGDAGGLKIMPFTATLDSYLQTAAHWAAFQELSDSLDINSKAFIGTESLSDVVNANLGKGWGTWLENYVKDLNGQARGDKAQFGLLGALRSNLARSALTLNPGVALKQTLSFLNYLTFIDGDIITKRFATGLLRTTKSFGSDALIKAVEEHTSMLKSRRTGLDVYGVDTEGGGKGVISRVTKALSKLGSSWITRMDVRTVSNGMLACADQVDRWIEDGTLRGVKKGTAAYYKEIADLFERATIDTQPIYQKEYRPDMFRTSNEVIRTAAMFGTQPAQNYNNLVETWGEYASAKKAGNTTAAKSALRKVEGTVAGIITSSFLFAMYGAVNGLLKHKLKDVRDDDGKVDPEKVFGPQAFYTWMSTLAGTSWVGRLTAPFVIDMLTARSDNPSNLFYGAEDGVYGLINDAANALLNFNKDPSLKKGKAAALTMAAAFGIPAKNGYDLLNSLVMYTADAIGINPKNQDDAITLLDSYFHAAPTTKGNNTASAAISMLGKGNEEAASAIMHSLDLDDKKVLTGMKTAFKDAIASGKIDESDVRKLLGDVKFDPDAVDTLISDAVKKKAAVEAEMAAKEEVAKIDSIDSGKVIDKLSEFNAENDKDSSGRMDYILGLGLSDKETDVLVRSYAGQDYARQYLTCYDALRDAGFSPTKANTIIQSINTDDNTTLKQAEFWEAYEKDKNSESYIEILWNAMGYTGKNTRTWADYKKSKAK